MRDTDGKMQLNFVVETKDVQGWADLRGCEPVRMKAAQRCFRLIKAQDNNATSRQPLNGDDIVKTPKQYC